MSKAIKQYPILIIGAGPAGIGTAIVLKKLGLDFKILEKDEVGSSFEKWPKESRLISPSFTSNFFGMPDLNSITPDTSPAFTVLSEHPTGAEYAYYLQQVSGYHNLSIETGVKVDSII